MIREGECIFKPEYMFTVTISPLLLALKSSLIGESAGREEGGGDCNKIIHIFFLGKMKKHRRIFVP